MTAVQVKRFNWLEARRRLGLTNTAAVLVATIRLCIWHWMQPLLYWFAFYSYSDELDRLQLIFGLVVGVREIIYFQKNFSDKSKFVPEGVEGRVEYKGKVSKIIYQLQGGLRSSMGYIGAKNLKEINKKAKFVKITKAGFYESMVHSVEMTQKTINYKL